MSEAVTPHESPQLKLPRSTCRYSAFAVQLPAIANSKPAPIVQPALVWVAPAKPGVDAAAAPNAQAPATPRTKFEFIEDKEPGLLVAKPGGGVPRAAGRAPGKRAKLRTQGSVNSRSRTKPMTLEETLEILGAGELKMDDGRAPLINDSSVAQPRPQPAKNKASRLGRLFERLSERMGS